MEKLNLSKWDEQNKVELVDVSETYILIQYVACFLMQFLLQTPKPTFHFTKCKYLYVLSFK